MKIEIWSDVLCPYCYIGKRRLEQALDQFEHSGDIEIEWKSFQLQPDAETRPEKNPAEHLAEVKGWSIEQTDQMFRRVTDMAAKEGLEFNMNDAIVANSFNAHRFAHYAKTQGKGDEAEEALFKAYFTDGKNIDDTDTLVALGKEIGMNAEETRKVLESEEYGDAVKQDIQVSQNIGIRGVPFFLFDRKYAISGAQQSEVFLKALNKSWSEWKNEQQPVELAAKEGEACDIDGEC